MHLKKFILGGLENNIYLLIEEETKEAILIDAGEEPDVILQFLEKRKIKLRYLLLTHGHFDHTSGYKKIKDATNAKVLIHKEDLNITFGTKVEPDKYLEDGDEILLGEIKIKVLHTPGHTKGCCCFYLEKERILFSGDTIFFQALGRTDFPEGNYQQEIKSIKEKIFTLPEETIIHPGHGPETSVENEKETLCQHHLL